MLTLWADDDNYIEFMADCINFGFILRVMLAGIRGDIPFGNDSQLWIPNSPLYLVLGYTNGLLWAGASLGGGQTVMIDSAVNMLAEQEGTPVFSELRFRSGPSAVSGYGEIANEVVTFRWIGGEFRDNGVDDSGIPAIFEELEWLMGPSP